MRPEGNPGHERLVQRARRRCGGGVGLGVGEVTGDDEPPKDPGPALEDQLRVEIWVVGAGSVDEPGEQGGLGPAEAVGGGVEVAAARGPAGTWSASREEAGREPRGAGAPGGGERPLRRADGISSGRGSTARSSSP